MNYTYPDKGLFGGGGLPNTYSMDNTLLSTVISWTNMFYVMLFLIVEMDEILTIKQEPVILYRERLSYDVNIARRNLILSSLQALENEQWDSGLKFAAQTKNRTTLKYLFLWLF